MRTARRQYRTCWQRCDRLRNSDGYVIYYVIYLYLTWKSNKTRVQSKNCNRHFLNQYQYNCCWGRGGLGGQLPRYWYWSHFFNLNFRGFLYKFIKGASVELVNQWRQLMKVFVVRAIVAKSRGAWAWNPDKFYQGVARFLVNLPQCLGAGDGLLRVQAAVRHR